eukprot:TRINITY_DN6665_c0_g1_i6.p1 TRINITY_DN6665_c0_g1~~TRINITY_DN6665_c0_g1_i6.p1  ORF type:complete len:767 (-),score=105.57 TRINITY_DN6665_c0_g1_i6:126-2357(-)
MASIPVAKPVQSRRSSIQVLKESLGFGGISRQEGNVTKKKVSLSHWSQFKTVCWVSDGQRDFEEHTSAVINQESFYVKAVAEIGTWVVPCFVGVLTATSGALIEKLVELWADLRFGFCLSFWKHSFFYALREECAEDDIVNWPYPYLCFIIACTIIAAVSASLTWAFAPMSRGSGIPEIKTILGGFTFPEVLAGNTLVIKIIGLSMSVGAGLSCGKEGPLVHIACCWANFVCKFIPRYQRNEAKQREMISCACAAGVAVAFGAPLGGVLFSLEEASSIFPTRTMLRAFAGACVAAMTLSWWNPTGTGKLTMFNAPYSSPPGFAEYPVFVIIGVVGGCVGALFVHWNVQISKARAPGTWFRARCHIILEVTLISFFTALTSYHLQWTKVLMNTTIKALFHDCSDLNEAPVGSPTWLDNCNGDQNTLEMTFVWGLLLAAFLRFIQMCFTFGTGAAAGLFIPSLYVGAALGRIAGIFVYLVNEKTHFSSSPIYPGMYSMLGAAGVLGGVCRVTISLVVIMFELTGGLQLIVPFMIVCMLAKWVGDAFTIGIYDYIIVVRKYPFLHEPDEVTFNTKASDIMDESIDCLHPECGSLGSVISFLKQARHGGYPLTQSERDPTLLGYIYTSHLLAHLENQMKVNQFVTENTQVEFSKFLDHAVSPSRRMVLDVSKFVDETVLTCVPETPAVQLQSIFRHLGTSIILFIDRGALVGLLTKKSFITHMEELHHSDHAKKSTGGLTDALLPTK